jgi:hypothetical protein
VRQEEGFFEAEGIEVEFDIKTFRGTQASWKGPRLQAATAGQALRRRRQGPDPVRLRLGQHLQRSAGMGASCPTAMASRPGRSSCGRSRRSGNPRISPTSRFRRHARRQPFQRALPLEKYLPLEKIKVVNSGGFGARLRALLDKEVEAASLLPPQIDMARQLGLRMIMEDEFHTLWWVPETADKTDVRAYLRGLDRAEQALKAI